MPLCVTSATEQGIDPSPAVTAQRQEYRACRTRFPPVLPDRCNGLRLLKSVSQLGRHPAPVSLHRLCTPTYTSQQPCCPAQLAKPRKNSFEMQIREGKRMLSQATHVPLPSAAMCTWGCVGHDSGEGVLTGGMLGSIAYSDGSTRAQWI